MKQKDPQTSVINLSFTDTINTINLGSGYEQLLWLNPDLLNIKFLENMTMKITSIKTSIQLLFFGICLTGSNVFAQTLPLTHNLIGLDTPRSVEC